MSAPARVAAAAASRTAAQQAQQAQQAANASKAQQKPKAGSKPSAPSTVPLPVPSVPPLTEAVAKRLFDTNASSSSNLTQEVASTAVVVDLSVAQIFSPREDRPQSKLEEPENQPPAATTTTSSSSAANAEASSSAPLQTTDVSEPRAAPASPPPERAKTPSQPDSGQSSSPRCSQVDSGSPSREEEVEQAGIIVRVPVENRPETEALKAKLEKMHTAFSLLKTRSDDFILRLDSLTAASIDFGPGNQLSISRPLDLYQTEFNTFMQDFDALVADMTLNAQDVLSTIKLLNTKVQHSPQKKLVMLGDFVTFWNNISAISDELKGVNDLIKSTIELLPDLRTFLLKINVAWFPIHNQKTFKGDGQQSKIEIDKHSLAVNAFLTKFNELNEEALLYQDRIYACIRANKPIKITHEQLKEYANHTEDQRIANKNTTDSIAKKVNEMGSEIQAVLIAREWKAVCKALDDYAIQLTQFASEGGYSLLNSKVLLSWNVFSRKVSQGEDSKELKSSVAFDQSLFG